MLFLSTPPGFDFEGRPVSFYLSMEEFAARRAAPGRGEMFFTWVTPPTVVCGRHQWIDKEVDLDACAAAGIDVMRRRSGGGAIFADNRNVMCSYIAPAHEVTTTFGHFNAMMTGLLRSMGLDASSTSRNDLLIGDKKVAGVAFYYLGGVAIVHSTMLVDTDFAAMGRVLTPSRAKLESKGVKSVNSRVTTLRSHLPRMTPGLFRELAQERLTVGTLTLTDADMQEILAIEATYRDPEWLAPRRRHGSTPRRRVEGAGEFQPEVTLDADRRIAAVTLGGDFFTTGALAPVLDRLRGVAPEADAIAAALGDDTPIAGIAPRELAAIIAEAASPTDISIK